MSILNGIYAATAIDSVELPQDVLNISNKSRSNPFTWRGQFSPQLIQALLERYSTPESVVVDPFLGSGTVLLESGNAGLAATGTDINPAAIAFAKTYHFINVPVLERHRHINVLGQELRLTVGNHSDHSKSFNSDVLKQRLVALAVRTNEPLQITLLEVLIVILDFYRDGLSVDKIYDSWNSLIRTVVKLPYSQQELRAINADARRVPASDSSVDLAVTSPPYINVFNYHQQYRASVEALCWSLLKVAESEIGANRKHRSNRFLTVIQYCLDIAQVLQELTRVCRCGARIIFVVGKQSQVRKTVFYNGEIVSELAHRALGLNLILRQQRVFLNRFGEQIYEDVLHFSPRNVLPDLPVLASARDVSRDVLETSYNTAKEEVKEDLRSALKKLEFINPSPLFDARPSLTSL